MIPPLPSSKPVIRVHTVHQRSITFSHNAGQSVADLKAHICQGKDLRPEELQLISSGKECSDNDQVSANSYLLIKSTATRCVEVTVKLTDDKSKRVVVLSLPLNTSIAKLKALLLKEKHTKCSVTGQRLISSSKVMKNHHILGDYLLLPPTSAGKRKGAQSSPPPLNIYLSQTIDSREEIEIYVTLHNKQVIKFYFEFGLPLYYAKNILQKQFAIPQSLQYFFSVEGGAAMTDMNKCLLDYGILPSRGKTLHVALVMDYCCIALPQSGLMCGNAISHLFIPPASAASLSPSLLASTTSLKKVPDSKRKSPTCSMFGGMKKGFLSTALGQKKKKHKQ